MCLRSTGKGVCFSFLALAKVLGVTFSKRVRKSLSFKRLRRCMRMYSSLAGATFAYSFFHFRIAACDTPRSSPNSVVEIFRNFLINLSSRPVNGLGL